MNPVLKTIRPFAEDPEYAYVECENGRQFALTLSGAANICGYVKEGDYAFGNAGAAKKAWEPLAKNMGLSVEETAKKVLDLSAAKNGRVINSLIQDYGLDKSAIVFVGGGGGAASVVPHLAETFGCRHKIAKNAAVISPIGVALAMVRDMVERTVTNPTEEDILSIRREAIRMAVQSGAEPSSVEVKIEIDAQRNKVRAIAIGTTELRTKDLAGKQKTQQELLEIVAENLKVDPERVKLEADNGSLCAVSCELIKRQFLVFKKKMKALRLIDRDGVIRLQKKNATVHQCPPSAWKSTVNRILGEFTAFGDGGEEIPNLYIALGGRIIDLSGIQSAEQIKALCEVELAGVQEDENLIMVCTLTAENERG